MTENVITVASKFQHKYFKSDAQIVVVGGAAGSSKSYVGLMRHLRWAQDPNYRAYCIRKNSTAIMKSGGLFWEAVKLYSQYDPKLKIRIKDQKLIFSDGAEVSFSHYDSPNAAKTYQGIQISNIFYDEVTHAAEEDIWWLWSRLRSDANNKPSIWMSCNPEPDTWLLKYVVWYLYPEGHELAGRPDPAKNGIVRYLLRMSGELVWGETAQELIDKYGNPDLSNDHKDQVKPISFQGIFGTIEDNPDLQRTNPSYKSNLQALPRIDKERLLYGNWFARPENSSYFSRTNVIEIDLHPPRSEFTRIVRAYDFAGVLPHDGNRSPDYTASVKMGKLKTGDYVILEVTRTRITFGHWMQHIQENAQRDGKGVEILLPEDPNPMAKASTMRMARDLNEMGYPTTYKRSGQGKLDSFRPFAATAQIGAVQVVKNCSTDLWNKVYNDNSFFYSELESFTGERKGGENGHDDMVDCCSSGYTHLASRFHIPNFLHGLQSVNLTSNNPFAK